ncbi:DUF4129 domain-containing protein [Porticoccus sp. W117]|uniref:DUF4129 domain-containing protein n=1 Tax=Porticoccus sp. W117 TaxID=3054777 RepID=UPI002593596A|nr:DUF4129 domain-containing protein [Porticoccus sp. W117]MDM3871366.1 DUF4129 domain-containing protein [Porticoccus sp. W117]
MQIDKISARLRLRNNWEAIDLGFSLARQWFLRLWLLWLVPATIVTALSLSLIDSVLLALVVAWWLQPLYERPLLHFLSRALFGEYPSVRRELRHYWQLVKPQLLVTILWRRFHPGRSFVEPVALLEGLKGKARSQRLSVLGLGTSGTAIWFGLLCWLFGRTLDGSQITLLYMLLPEELNLWFMENIASRLLSWQQGEDLHWLAALVWLTSTSLVAPFFIAGGFALYLSRRTRLEGWDIELAFRRMANRQQKRAANGGKAGAALALTLCLCGALLAPPAPASEYSKTPDLQADKTLAEEIAAQPEFGELETREVWRPIEKEKPKAERNWFEKLRGFFEWLEKVLPALGLFLKVVIVLLLVALIVWLIIRFTSWLDWLNLPGKGKRRKQTPPSSLFGLELGRESLPDDVAASALKLLENDHIREAISLLFRAALSHMVHHSELPISDSSTEGECLRLAERHRPASELGYFRRLTDTWLLLAYAHQPPSAEHTRELCQNWAQHYRDERSAESGSVS